MRLTLLACALLTPAAQAQWQLQQSNTSASLRGIHSLGQGIAWASGTEGTILRTTDQGQHWQHCATPPAAEHLDFRGIQAFDAQTAIVMSSGKGDLSRLYKTTDACQTWQLLRTNVDKDGFWDAIVFASQDAAELVGDPVKGHFAVINKVGPAWTRVLGPSARQGESAFAASNSSVLSFGRADYMLATGGVHGPRVIFFHEERDQGSWDLMHFVEDTRDVPIATGKDSTGIFALAMKDRQTIVAVGGDYLKPDDIIQTSAITLDGGKHWTAPTTPPHGYRSSVAYLPTQKSWITVGPNGTDVSTDDGRNWHALKPQPGEALDSDRNWNALSLPFVVGPHGRIGLLNPIALSDEPRSRPIKGTASAVP